MNHHELATAIQEGIREAILEEMHQRAERLERDIKSALLAHRTDQVGRLHIVDDGHGRYVASDITPWAGPAWTAKLMDQ